MILYRKIVFKHIMSIITTLLFLIVSTYCWFNLRNREIYETYVPENVSISSEVVLNSLEKISDDNIANLNGYDFTISNTGNKTEDFKIMIIGDLLQKNVSNNYIKYSINNNKVRSLNMDGIIYIDNLNESETKDINLKIWISDTYQGDLGYNGRVIVS